MCSLVRNSELVAITIWQRSPNPEPLILTRRAPDRRPAGGAAGGGAEEDSPMMRVRTLEVMSPAECEAAVEEAEAWGAAN